MLGVPRAADDATDASDAWSVTPARLERAPVEAVDPADARDAIDAAEAVALMDATAALETTPATEATIADDATVAAAACAGTNGRASSAAPISVLTRWSTWSP